MKVEESAQLYGSTSDGKSLSSPSSWDCCLAVNEECPVRFAVWPLTETDGRTLSQRLEGSDWELEMTRKEKEEKERRGARWIRSREEEGVERE